MFSWNETKIEDSGDLSESIFAAFDSKQIELVLVGALHILAETIGSCF